MSMLEERCGARDVERVINTVNGTNEENATKPHHTHYAHVPLSIVNRCSVH